jgi:hypothetical protein
LNYAIDAGIIETDNQYTPGQKSKGYRFREMEARPKVYKIQKKTLIKAVKKYRKPPKEYDFLNKHFEGLQVNYNAAYEYIEAEKKGVFNQSYYRAHQCAYDIQHRQFSLSVDNNIFRYHSNLTGMNKELRNFCTYDGVQLVCIDLKGFKGLPFIIL